MTDTASVLVRAACDINAPRDLGSTVEAIATVAASSLDGIDHVGVSIAKRDGETETVAWTDPLAWEADQLQYDLDEGPCLDAIRGRSVVWVNHVRTEQRWPRYVRQVLQHGIRAQLGLGLCLDEKTFGGMNLYSTSTDVISPEVQHRAALIANLAAIALDRTLYEEQLNTALATQKTIGQAIGIVMERFGMDQQVAFQYLLHASQQNNIKLRRVAQELVDQHDSLTRDIGVPFDA